MKNPFNRLNELEDRIADLENKNLADKLLLIKTALVNNKKEWQDTNPPIFKQGEMVDVFEKRTPNSHAVHILYTGKIVCILRVNEEFAFSSKKYANREYVYCIDAFDFKFHEAPESLIKISL